MDIANHIEALSIHGERLAAAAEVAGLDAPVPTCPDWRVRDLVAHTGGVHRWAATIVREATFGPLGPERVQQLFAKPDDADLFAWFGEAHAALGTALSEADPELSCLTFLPAPSPLAFWARRQAHETAIHRVDAEKAARAETTFSVEFAADGLAELIEGFMARPGGALYADPPVSLAIEATDADCAWTVRIGPTEREVVVGVDAADATMRGPVNDLYLTLWNRRSLDDLDVSGDVSVLDLWRERARV